VRGNGTTCPPRARAVLVRLGNGEGGLIIASGLKVLPHFFPSHTRANAPRVRPRVTIRRNRARLLADRTAAALHSALVGTFSYAPEPPSERPRRPDHSLAAPKVAGSSPIVHPLDSA